MRAPFHDIPPVCVHKRVLMSTKGLTDLTPSLPILKSDSKNMDELSLEGCSEPLVKLFKERDFLGSRDYPFITFDGVLIDYT